MVLQTVQNKSRQLQGVNQQAMHCVPHRATVFLLRMHVEACAPERGEAYGSHHSHTAEQKGVNKNRGLPPIALCIRHLTRNSPNGKIENILRGGGNQEITAIPEQEGHVRALLFPTPHHHQ